MSTRRGVGLSAFQNRSSLSSSYANHGASLRSTNLASFQTQLSVFRSVLHNFALQHADTIKSDPSFRAEFAQMCNTIGVDPLAGSNVKGKNKGNWWGQIMGGDVNDFYIQVAMRVVEVCRASRGENGGLIGVDECKRRVSKGRALGGEIDVSEYAKDSLLAKFTACGSANGSLGSADILQSIKSLEPLGSGFSIITVGSKQMIRSVPKELNTDQSIVLEAILLLGYVTRSMLEDNLGWEPARAETVIEDLLGDSLVWVDLQASEKEYWSPAFMDNFED